MATSELVMIVIVAILLCVIGIFILSSRQSAASKRALQIANFRFRAEEAQAMHDNLRNAGLDLAAYHLLLQRVVDNYESASAIDPNQPGLSSRLDAAKVAIASIDDSDYYLEMPSSTVEVQGVLANMKKFHKYVELLHERKILSDVHYREILPSLQRSMFKLDAECHIRLGHQAANEKQYGTAKQSFINARTTLIEFDPDDPYSQQQLGLINELLRKISKIEAQHLAQAIDVLQEDIVTPELNEIPDDQEIDPEEEKARKAALEQEKLNQLNEETGGYEVKKKW